MKADWFVAWVTTGQELELLRKIRQIEGIAKAICPVLPLYKAGILLGMGTDAYTNEWTLKDQIVFPGYIFLRCRMSSTVYYAIRELPGVLGWLGRDSMWPTTVREEEMDVVLALDRGDDPETVLTNVRAEQRRRRAYGSMTLQGKQYRIPYNIYYNDKQAEEPPGDASPAGS